MAVVPSQSDDVPTEAPCENSAADLDWAVLTQVRLLQTPFCVAGGA